MKTVCLTTDEQLVLVDILECCISDLRVEIVGTENWQFKRELHQRKDLILALLEKFKAAVNEHLPTTAADATGEPC
jgi:hypothetical protein